MFFTLSFTLVMSFQVFIAVFFLNWNIKVKKWKRISLCRSLILFGFVIPVQIVKYWYFIVKVIMSIYRLGAKCVSALLWKLRGRRLKKKYLWLVSKHFLTFLRFCLQLVSNGLVSLSVWSGGCWRPSEPEWLLSLPTTATWTSGWEYRIQT